MAKISAPYNFVPLNEKVFFPPWANLVNHDIPFKDGLSGQIELEIKAETPIFIHGEEEVNDENPQYKQYRFPKKGKRYYIPGSSIRNMLRSVVEIMSFSKLNIINNYKKTGFRDMANPNLYNLRKGISRELRYGWLFKNNKGIYIESNGVVGDLRKELENTVNIRNHPNFSHMRSCYRRNLNETDRPTLSKKYSKYHEKNKYSAINYSSQDDEPVIVLTGYISEKTHEFIFKKPSFTTDHSVSEELFNNFKLANIVEGKYNDNWSFWEDKFNNNLAVPVFYRVDKKNNVIDFGLTVLYKMLHKNSVLDILKKNQPEYDDNRLDLTETIFGKADNSYKLKSRVIVEHAFTDEDKEIHEYKKQNLVLGEPKHSFYPNYIKQKVNADGFLNSENKYITAKYQTLSNNNAVLSGRKRYPVHSKESFDPSDINQEVPENQEVITSFYPLDIGTVFKTKIKYHNLLPVELGALLSAITFHNTNNCKHNIGFAKPYGFGRIKIKIKNDNFSDKYMSLYEKLLNDFTNREMNKDWLETDQLKELFSMAFMLENQDRDKLKYMKLADFQQIKKAKKEDYDDCKKRLNKERVSDSERIRIEQPKALPLYSDFMKITNLSIKSMINPNSENLDLNYWDKAVMLDTKNLKLSEKINKIKNQLETINTKLYKLQSNLKKIEKKSHELTSISFKDIVNNQNQILPVIIKSLKPKIATTKIDGKLTDVQLIIPKWIDISKLSIGEEIKVKIHQISVKNQKIVSVKIIED